MGRLRPAVGGLNGRRGEARGFREGGAGVHVSVPSPSYGHHAYMAACYAYLGLEDRAKAQATTTLEKKSNFSAKEYVSSALFPPLYQKEEDVTHLLDGLCKARLPE